MDGNPELTGAPRELTALTELLSFAKACAEDIGAVDLAHDIDVARASAVARAQDYAREVAGRSPSDVLRSTIDVGDASRSSG